MIDLPEETILRLQKSFKKSLGVDYTFEEAREASYNFIGLMSLLCKIDREQKLKKKNQTKD